MEIAEALKSNYDSPREAWNKARESLDNLNNRKATKPIQELYQALDGVLKMGDEALIKKDLYDKFGSGTLGTVSTTSQEVVREAIENSQGQVIDTEKASKVHGTMTASISGGVPSASATVGAEHAWKKSISEKSQERNDQAKEVLNPA